LAEPEHAGEASSPKPRSFRNIRLVAELLRTEQRLLGPRRRSAAERSGTATNEGSTAPNGSG
jgi:hypothetical protein